MLHVGYTCTGLSLTLGSPVALITTPITNLLLFGLIVSRTGKSSRPLLRALHVSGTIIQHNKKLLVIWPFLHVFYVVVFFVHKIL